MTKLVVISDTHGLHSKLKLPEGDILIHAGDFTTHSNVDEFEDFLTWIGSIETKYKKVMIIPGNHDHGAADNPFMYKDLLKRLTKNTIDLWLETYEKGQTYEFEGFSFFGFPHAAYSIDINRFFLSRDNYKKLIPNLLKCDILVAHAPPHGILDTGGRQMVPLGSKALYNKIFELQPKLVISGHIHEQYGIQRVGNIDFINATQLDYDYELTKEPIVYEIE